MKELKDFIDLCERGVGLASKTKDFLNLFHEYLESLGIHQTISYHRLYKEMIELGYFKRRTRINGQDHYLFDNISIDRL